MLALLALGSPAVFLEHKLISSLWLDALGSGGRATVAYLSEWQDPRSLWYAAVQKSQDPDVYHMLGAQYLNLAESIGVKPLGDRLPENQARRLAAIVWEKDPQLPALGHAGDHPSHRGAGGAAWLRLGLGRRPHALPRRRPYRARPLGRVDGARCARSLDMACARRRGAFALASRGRKESPMLRIYQTALEVIVLLRPVIAELRRRDPHLAEQLTDASNGVAQCIAEGSYSRGRNRHALYHRALGSAKESGSCISPPKRYACRSGCGSSRSLLRS